MRTTIDVSLKVHVLLVVLEGHDMQRTANTSTVDQAPCQQWELGMARKQWARMPPRLYCPSDAGTALAPSPLACNRFTTRFQSAGVPL